MVAVPTFMTKSAAAAGETSAQNASAAAAATVGPPKRRQPVLRRITRDDFITRPLGFHPYHGALGPSGRTHFGGTIVAVGFLPTQRYGGPPIVASYPFIYIWKTQFCVEYHIRPFPARAGFDAESKSIASIGRRRLTSVRPSTNGATTRCGRCDS